MGLKKKFKRRNSYRRGRYNKNPVSARLWRLQALTITGIRVGVILLVLAGLAYVWEGLLGGWLLATALCGAGLQAWATSKAVARGRKRMIRRHRATPPAVAAAVDDLISSFGLSRRRLGIDVSDLGGRKAPGVPLAAATSGLNGAVLFVDDDLARKAAMARPGSSDDDEVRAVMAHELAHVFAQDIAVKTVSAWTVSFTLWALVLGAVYAWGGGVNGVTVGVLGVSGVVVTALVDRFLGRKAEYTADRRAGRATGRPLALRRALMRDFYGTSRGWKDWISTHPPTDRRCDRLRDQAKAMGKKKTNQPK